MEVKVGDTLTYRGEDTLITGIVERGEGYAVVSTKKNDGLYFLFKEGLPYFRKQIVLDRFNIKLG